MTDANSRFHEILVVADDQISIWPFLRGVLGKINVPFLRLPSNASIRKSWHRFQHAPRIIVQWEGSGRRGGAIIEEILDVCPHYYVAEQIIVITTDPTHEDVVYLSELGVSRIIRFRNRDKEILVAGEELRQHVAGDGQKNKSERLWRELLRVIDLAPTNATLERFQKIEQRLYQLQELEGPASARFYYALAGIRQKMGQKAEAESFYRKALDLNSNYFRAYNKLVELLKDDNRLGEALAIMKKLHAWNKENISRMCDMGDIYARNGEDEKAKHQFHSALERDEYCSRALNGMASIQFRAGNLDEARKYLAHSNLAYQLARELNLHGIELVREKKYAEALDHYTRAQYVIPQQDKGPMLFYNMGLCYSRWNKIEMAKEFLKLALIKEPTYSKARKLLDQLSEASAKGIDLGASA